ncbi:sugar ABC transporter ATP-binding protein, partial [Rhizobiaceae sp. 2RAB30]
RMAASGMGIIYISHFLDEVIDIADRVTVLRDGRVAEEGPGSAFTVDRLAELLVGTERRRENQEPVVPPARRPQANIRLKLDDFGARGRRPFSLELGAGEVFGLAGL